MTRALVAAAALLALAGCYLGDGAGLPCEGSDNCPSHFVCREHVCAAPPASRTTFVDAPSPATAPRVVDGGAGVEVYALAGDCGGLARWRPDSGAFDVVAPADTGCFVALDAARGDDGVVRAVMRRALDAGSDACSVSVDVDGATAPTVYAQDAPGDQRGLAVRALKGAGGAVTATWVTKPGDGGDEVIEDVALDGGQPAAFGAFPGDIEAFALVVDDNGDEARFAVDAAEGKLLFIEPDATRFLQAGVSGSIDAVRCGDAVHVLYRKDDELRLVSIRGSAPATAERVAAGLGTARTDGDLALACDDGTLWAAYVDGATGRLSLAERTDADWTSNDVDAAAGAVSLVVHGGRPELAYVGAGGLRFATQPP